MFEEEYAKKIETQKKSGLRISVSAEVYGEYFKKENFTPPVYQKSQEKIDEINSILSNSFMFSVLED